MYTVVLMLKSYWPPEAAQASKVTAWTPDHMLVLTGTYKSNQVALHKGLCVFSQC